METLRSHALSGFDVFLKSFPPRHQCRWGGAVPGRLCVFLDGSMHEGRRSYTAADVVYKPPEDRPELRFGEHGARTLTVELRPPGLEALQGGGFDVARPFSVRSPECQSLAERARAEMTHVDEMTPLMLEGLLLELFSRSHRQERLGSAGSAPSWLVRVRERVEAEFRSSRTLRDYALEAGVHPMKLAASFRRHYGTSLGAHVRALRVHYAACALSDGSRSVAEIALAAGFCDQSHLTRVFKRATGSTPSHYRARS